jgi:5'-methylthioadenosine phosphorylase
MRIGIIGGTGVGESLRGGLEAGSMEACDVETPFGRPSAPIEAGVFRGVPVALLARHGIGHVLPPAAVPARANIFALKMLGCTHIVATGATGSLRESIRPGDLVVCDQLIDRTAGDSSGAAGSGRPRSFFDRAAVHVEFAEPCCPIMRQWLLTASTTVPDLSIHPRGCYVCIEGPSFSTKAESHMHRQWGADVVGMTALPEARLAREAEIAYALLALPTDYDCWKPRQESVPEASLLEQIRDNLHRATQASLALLRAALSDVRTLRDSASPAHQALRLAIWSDPARIDPAEMARLEPLWGRYLNSAAVPPTRGRPGAA